MNPVSKACSAMDLSLLAVPDSPREPPRAPACRPENQPPQTPEQRQRAWRHSKSATVSTAGRHAAEPYRTLTDPLPACTEPDA